MSNFDLIKSLYKAIDLKDNNLEKNAVIYTRVSTKEQAENNNSLETQRKYCDQYAEKNNYNVSCYFGGLYESAKTDGRKEFKRMLEFINKPENKVESIIVFSTDRFSRTGGHAIAIAEELRKTGIHIISCSQPTDTKTSSGKFQQNMQFLFSEYDNELRKEKCVTGMKEKLYNGYWMGKAPHGYKHVGFNKNQKLEITAAGEVIRKAFYLKAEHGLSNTEISQRCKAFGHFIHEKRLSVIFKNPFYCGYIKNKLLGDEITKGKHEPLISEEVFLKVNNIGFNNSKNYVTKQTDELFPLKRFITCEKCGTTWVGYTVKNKKATYYKCNKKECRCNRNASVIHEGFNKYLSTYSIPERFVEPMKLQLGMTFKEMNKDNEVSKILINANLNEVKEKLNKLEERYALGEVEDKEVYKRLKVRFWDEINAITGELSKVDLKLSNLDNFVNYTVKLSSKLNVMWGLGSFELKQGLQNLIFPDGVTYNFQNNTYRTCRSNSVFASIAVQARVLEQKETGIYTCYGKNSGQVELSYELSNLKHADILAIEAFISRYKEIF
ncbi:MAG: recombinase family protein [Bacteroidota bacterium]